MRRREYVLSMLAVSSIGGCLGLGQSGTPTPDAGQQSGGAGGGSTPSPTQTATNTATPTPEAALDPIDEPAMRTAIHDAVVAARGSSVSMTGTLSRRLQEMATYHSDRMAEERTVAHEIGGEDTEDRFEQFEINCRFRDNDGTYMYQMVDYEVVGSVSTRGVTVEEAAETLVAQWLEDPDSKETLLLENAETVGIGVTIVIGEAYVTLVYC